MGGVKGSYQDYKAIKEYYRREEEVKIKYSSNIDLNHA